MKKRHIKNQNEIIITEEKQSIKLCLEKSLKLFDEEIIFYIGFKYEPKGIPENILKHIFDMTQATSRPGTMGEPGTGFGMPLVKRFVNAYDGSIEVKSIDEKIDLEGHGSTVILKLKNGRGKI